jgi:hypothetical protein
MLKALLLVMERLAALALAKSSVTVALDVLPIVTALELVGTPAVQFPATLQFPEMVFQASAVAGVASGLTANGRGAEAKLNWVKPKLRRFGTRPMALGRTEYGDLPGTWVSMSANRTSLTAITLRDQSRFAWPAPSCAQPPFTKMPGSRHTRPMTARKARFMT